MSEVGPESGGYARSGVQNQGIMPEVRSRFSGSEVRGPESGGYARSGSRFRGGIMPEVRCWKCIQGVMSNRSGLEGDISAGCATLKMMNTNKKRLRQQTKPSTSKL